MSTAMGLMETCYKMSAMTATGLAPDCTEFNETAGMQPCPGRADKFYFLRPEVSESLFVLYQLTKNNTYRDWAVQIFNAIDKHCRADAHGGAAYGIYEDVRVVGKEPADSMESFFLSETLKYLYLIFDDAAPSLSEYV